MQTEIILIEGMGCDACSTRIERALNALEGVTSASVELASKKAAVTFDPGAIGLTAIKEAIIEEGYEVVGE